MDGSDTEKCHKDAKKLEKWLENTNMRYHSLQTHMKFMKMIWHDIQPKINSHASKIQSSEGIEPMQLNGNDMTEKFDNIQYTSVHNIDDTEKCESFHYSNLGSISPKIKKQLNEEENIQNVNVSKEAEVKLNATSPNTYSVPQNACTQSTPMSPLHKDNMNYNEQNGSWQSSYKKHLAEYSTDLMEDVENPKKSVEELILDSKNEYLLQELSSVRDNIKLHISGSIKNGPTSKYKTRTKGDKKEKAIRKGSLCKIDDIGSLKLKKRRGKLHSSNSKSTVTTRDTNFVGRKDTKKRRQKGGANNRHSLKPQQTCNEVVEIYHNAAAKNGSTSIILSKHSKSNHYVNCVNKSSAAANKQQSVHVKPENGNSNYEHHHEVDKNHWQIGAQRQCQSKTEEGSKRVHDENCNFEVSTTPVYTMEKCNSHECQHAIMQETYCNPMITHNYEMPTLASKLKRANRSYFSRFNFRNIPFVVGTSVTPSHNLGLNIQQVLSIMKTRQPAVSGITPLLIRKVSRGMKPVSILMEQVNDQYSKLSHMNSRISNTLAREGNSFISGSENFLENETASLKSGRKVLSNLNLNLNLKSNMTQYRNVQETVKKSTDACEHFHNKQCSQDTTSENQLSRCNKTQVPQNINDAKMLKFFASHQNVKTQIEIPGLQLITDQDNVQNGDLCNVQSVRQSQSSKGIRDVLINLHDQFEEMNTKYEKLQERAKKNKEKDLEGEMLNLEKELNAKEDEINALVSLYKEVMALKHQMKLIQEKNSYVCISTEVPLSANSNYSATPFTLSRLHGPSHQQRYHSKRGSTTITREPSTSIRLAGLLRQIQTFQKQLRST